MFTHIIASVKRLSCWIPPHLLYSVLKANPQLTELCYGGETDAHVLNLYDKEPPLIHDLKVLKLLYSPPPYIQFPCLTTLEVGSGKEYTHSVFDLLFQQCPRLTSLTLNHVNIGPGFTRQYPLARLSLFQCSLLSRASCQQFLSCFPTLKQLTLRSLELSNGSILSFQDILQWAEATLWTRLTHVNWLLLSRGMIWICLLN